MYNAFIVAKKSPEWCGRHFVNYRGLVRAVDIRKQLVKYMKRFRIPIVSAKGDPDKVRQCLVSGYFAHAAKIMPDGTYKTVRGNQVREP